MRIKKTPWVSAQWDNGQMDIVERNTSLPILDVCRATKLPSGYGSGMVKKGQGFRPPIPGSHCQGLQAPELGPWREDGLGGWPQAAGDKEASSAA